MRIMCIFLAFYDFGLIFTVLYAEHSNGNLLLITPTAPVAAWPFLPGGGGSIEMAPSITNTIFFFLTILAVQGRRQEIQSGGGGGGLELIALFDQKTNIGKGRRVVVGGPWYNNE